MNRLHRALACITAAAGLAVIGSAPVHADTTGPRDNGQCAVGDVCFWSVDQKEYSDDPCSWSGGDKDWTSGATQCSWAGDTNAGFVYNNGLGEPSAVIFYTGKNWKNRVGCIDSDHDGALSGSYRIMSHRWANSC